jgi:hypothetical protein
MIRITDRPRIRKPYIAENAKDLRFCQRPSADRKFPVQLANNLTGTRFGPDLDILSPSDKLMR